MRNIYIIILLFTTTFSSAQYYLDGVYYQIRPLDTDKLKMFYYIEYEFDPAKSSKTLAEIEKIANENKNPSVGYFFTKENNQLIKVTVRANNKIYSEAYYKNGLLEGKKTIYHGSGNPFHEMEFVKGKANGVYKMYSDRGFDLVLETNFKNNSKDGKRTLYLHNRDKISVEGIYKNGILTSELIVKDEYSTYHYPNDFKNGKVKRFTQNQLIEEYEIRAGFIHGNAIIYNIGSGKMLSKTPYTFGKKNGTAEYYCKQGELMTKSEFKFDKKIGNHQLFTQDFKLTEIQNYDENGNKTGKWLKYYQNGKKDSETFYQKNGSIETTAYDGDENIRSISNYNKFNKQEGISKQYKNGILENEFFHQNNKTKWAKTYYKNGSIFSIETLKGEFYEGEYFDKEGKLIHFNKLNENGKRIGIHKSGTLNNDELYFSSESHYDENNKKIKWIYYPNYGNHGKTEINYRNELQHGKIIEFDKDGKIIKEIYSYETNGKSRIVTKEEFEQLTKDEKK